MPHHGACCLLQLCSIALLQALTVQVDCSSRVAVCRQPASHNCFGCVVAALPAVALLTATAVLLAATAVLLTATAVLPAVAAALLRAAITAAVALSSSAWWLLLPAAALLDSTAAGRLLY